MDEEREEVRIIKEILYNPAELLESDDDYFSETDEHLITAGDITESDDGFVLFECKLDEDILESYSSLRESVKNRGNDILLNPDLLDTLSLSEKSRIASLSEKLSKKTKEIDARLTSIGASLKESKFTIVSESGTRHQLNNSLLRFVKVPSQGVVRVKINKLDLLRAILTSE